MDRSGDGDSYVEVIGTGTAQEQVSEYRVALLLSVRSGQSKAAMVEVGELRDTCIRALRDAGLRDDELREGGAGVWRYWPWKKAPRREASHKILVASSDATRLFEALRSIEPLFDEKRFTIAVDMRRPKFEATADERNRAHAAAFADARVKAEVLTAASGLRIAAVLQIQELDPRTTRSGAYGDDDWGGHVFSAALPESSGPEELGAAVREVRYSYRVRFRVEPA